MLPVLVQSLLLASSGLLSVGSITLVILMLISDRGWTNGLGYALGYTGAYTLIGLAVVSFGYRAAPGGHSEPGLVFPVVVIILGSLLVFLSFRNRRKPAAETTQPPRFFAIVDEITPWKALGLGALVSVVNFKNLTLYLTALSVVVLSSLPLSAKITVTILDALVFCLSVIVPVLIYLAYPKRARSLLGAFKDTLSRHSRTIGIWAPLVFGALLILKGFSDLL